MLTQSEVRKLLDYNPDTGLFTWKVNRQGQIKAGYPAGYKRKDGYVKIKVRGHAVFAHRLAWLFIYGHFPAEQVDHINGNPSDNRISNLRDVAPAVNVQNVRCARRSNLHSRLLGAHWSTKWKRWKSAISANGKLVHVGWFDTEQQAHNAYIEAKRRLHAGCSI